MYVVQYELPALDHQPLRKVPRTSVASINTHDMPPFAAFWEGLDLQDRLTLGLMDAAGVSRERALHEARKAAFLELLQREFWLPRGVTDLPEILAASLSSLAASPAGLLIANLEDFAKDVERVTVADIRDTFQRRIRPDRMVTVVVAGEPEAKQKP